MKLGSLPEWIIMSLAVLTWLRGEIALFRAWRQKKALAKDESARKEANNLLWSFLIGGGIGYLLTKEK